MLTLYLAPSGKLYLKLQEYLAQEKTATNIISLPATTSRHSGQKKLQRGIPSIEWLTIVHRIVDNQEPLRKVADDYGVSHETIRRTVRKARKQQRIG